MHPRDIFVTPDEARASGFGVVEALERVGLRAPVRRPYTAPERIAGAGWSTPADVFSLAAIAFELLTGRRPSGTGADIGPLTGAIAPAADRLQAVLARAMAEDPADRFASGLALADALAAAGALADALAAVAGAGAAPPTFADEAEAVEPEVDPPADPGSSIRMIAIPVEAPVFAEEAPETRAATTPSLFVDVPVQPGSSATIAARDEPTETSRPEADDIAAERDEDEAHWALTRDEDAVVESGSVIAPDLEAAEYAPADVEAAADAVVFDAADLTLREAAAPADDFHPFGRAERLPAPRPIEFEPDEPAEEAYEPAAPVAPPRFDRAESAPPQVIEREIPRPQSHEADERVPFEHFGGASEPPRRSALPLALMLLVGLLVGFGGGYFARGRQTATPAPAGAGASAPSATVEPVGPPAPTGNQAGNRPAAAPTAAPRAATPPAPVAEARSGTLIVRSAPSGAGVTLNGKWSGRTPLTSRALAFGDYTVRVTLPGYQSKPEQVTLSADAASRTLSVQLQKEAPRPATPAAAPLPAPAASSRPAAEISGATVGGLEIDSRPTGARVFVDDRAVGTTPVRLPEVTPGSHAIRMELPEHRVWTETVQVTRGKTTRVAGSLEPIR